MGFERADRLGVRSISGNMSISCGILPHSLMGILAAFPPQSLSGICKL